MSKEIPISRIMTKREKVITVSIPGSRTTLLDLIKKHGFSSYPVLKKDSDELVGIVSRSDLFKNPSETQISLLMVRDPITLTKSDSIEKAIKILSDNVFQRIPIVDENKNLLGILSRDDIVSKHIVATKIDVNIEEYVNRNITAIWSETPLTVAAMILRLSHQKGLPVLEEDKMVGILSQQDFLKVAEVFDSQKHSSIASGAENDASSWDSESILVIGAKILTLPRTMIVREIMETKVETCYKGSTITDVAKIMRAKKIDQLPVLKADGIIHGMINQRLILRAYLDSL